MGADPTDKKTSKVVEVFTSDVGQKTRSVRQREVLSARNSFETSDDVSSMKKVNKRDSNILVAYGPSTQLQIGQSPDIETVLNQWPPA